MTHTPAPWIKIDDKNFNTNISITTKQRIEDNMPEIAFIDTDFFETFGEEQEANANLIVAAPDLLDALALLWSWATNGHDIRLAILTDKMVGEIVKKAILKAEGK